MKEIKFFGRGGQGAVTAAQVLATAAFNEGRFAQTFPQFGAERRGAPVIAYIRLDDQPIPIRSKIYSPDEVIVMDFNLFKMLDPLADLKPGGLTILNYPDGGPPLDPEIVRRAGRLFTVDATRLAYHIYGRTAIPITNTIILGAYCAAAGGVSLEAVGRTLAEFFPADKTALNQEAVRLGFDQVRGLP